MKKKQEVTFKYSETFGNHFRYRHVVDDHNNLRHAVPSIEGCWGTRRWANRVFSFVLAVSEVNTYLAFRYFIWAIRSNAVKRVPTLLEFRKKLALALIHNDYLNKGPKTPERSGRKRLVEHYLETAPLNAKKFKNGKWDTNAQCKYQQYICRGLRCKRRVRTHCHCAMGHWLCSDCYAIHLVDEVTTPHKDD